MTVLTLTSYSNPQINKQETLINNTNTNLRIIWLSKINFFYCNSILQTRCIFFAAWQQMDKKNGQTKEGQTDELTKEQTNEQKYKQTNKRTDGLLWTELLSDNWAPRGDAERTQPKKKLYACSIFFFFFSFFFAYSIFFEKLSQTLSKLKPAFP